MVLPDNTNHTLLLHCRRYVCPIWDSDSVLRTNSKFQFRDNWEYTPDTDIGVFQSIDTRTILPSESTTSLCNRCERLELLSDSCSFRDTTTNLGLTAPTCRLCQLLLSWCKERTEVLKEEPIEFFKAGSRLAAQGYEKKGIATLCYLPHLTHPPRGLQLGFPQLPKAGGPIHTSLISKWLDQCDKNHQCYPQDINFLPTRLIDVGSTDSPTVQLTCATGKLSKGTKYIALSHRWGSEHQKTLKALKANLKGQNEWIIPLEELPRTFRDAVHATRNLSHSFLWIDSLCIIQDDPEDWHRESQRMEAVFSSAYCVLAATCASGTDDGFLKFRPKRQVVPMKDAKAGISYYVCESINDFANDVDNSELNSRGWVLQERALARRTVHFTSNQTYWECGGGVRCETLTKMNKYISLLLCIYPPAWGS